MFQNEWEACASGTHLWCIDDQPSGQEGFEAEFLVLDNPCLRRHAMRERMRWDGLGHLLYESTADDDGEASSSVSPLVIDGCYVVRVLGRFMHGACAASSSSSSSSCPEFFCPGDLQGSSGWPRGTNDDEEDDVQDLDLCFDELGHLVAVYVCEELVWHQDNDDFGGIPSGLLDESSSLSSSGLEFAAGVVLELFMPVDESSSSSESSSCEVMASNCEAIPALSVLASFDSLGHLKHVTQPVEENIVCGVRTDCCVDGGNMPKQFLIVWSLGATLDEPAGGSATVCSIASWDGCAWGGTVEWPCCIGGVLSVVELPFAIQCIDVPGSVPEVPDGWHLCIATIPVLTTGSSPTSCCPVDSVKGGAFKLGECDDVAFVMHWMEIPCALEDCGSAEAYDCAPPSSTSAIGP